MLKFCAEKHCYLHTLFYQPFSVQHQWVSIRNRFRVLLEQKNSHLNL